MAVTLVGSRGRMGLMLTERLRKAGHKVLGLSKADLTAGQRGVPASALSDRDIILLCVPVTALPEALQALRTRMPGRLPLLMDITSVKVRPMLLMEEHFPGPVIGSHPLFGPRPLPEEMRVALARGSRAEERHCRMAEMLFRSIGCSVFWCGAEEHDRGVGLAQSLNFALSAAYFTSLARFGDRRFLTPSFRRHLEAARKHLTVDAAMFCEFTALNPHFPELLHRYAAVLAEAAEPDASGENGGLRGLAREAAVWYAEDDAAGKSAAP